MTFGERTVTCPRCRHYLIVSAYITFWRCEICGKFFDYTELIPFYYSTEITDRNPKSCRHDWIEQEEELSMAILLGNIKG